MIEVIGLYSSCARKKGLPQNLVFIFYVENWLHGKVKTWNISDTETPIFIVLSHMFGKIMGY